MKDQAQRMTLACLSNAIRNFSQASIESKTFWQSSLPLELAFVETQQKGCSSASSPPASQQKSRAEQSSGPEEDAGANEPKFPGEPGNNPEPSPPGNTGFQLVMDHWGEILSAIYEHDPRTQALLNSSKPLGIERGELLIAFRSDLLREKMEKGHNLALVQKALQMVLGHEIGIRCVLLDRWQGSGKSSTDSSTPLTDGGMVETALRDLGAQVVDVEQIPSEGQHRSRSN
jgi:hypothetical protein